MSDPPTHPDPDFPDRGLDVLPGRDPRPSGEAGGHTVQDWEQPPLARSLSTPAEPESGPAPPQRAQPGVHDEPSPETIPLYLRSAAATAAPEPAEPLPAVEARTRILTAQSAAIVDSITRGLAEALAVSLRPVVASTVVALLPMMLSLGSIPEDEWPEAARPAWTAAPAKP